MAEISENIKDKNQRRDVRRNTSNQIVSYTLPNNSVTQYGLVKLPAVKEELNKEQFEKVINTTIEDFSVVNPNTDVQVFSLNDVLLPQRAAVIQTISDTVPFEFKFNGDIIRVSDSLYYVEEGVAYKLPENNPGLLGFPWKHGTALTLLSEKLDKPFLFRLNSEDEDGDFLELDYQYGEPRPTESWDKVFEVKSDTYLSGLEEGPNFKLADLSNNIQNVVVRFDFGDLIDQINPPVTRISIKGNDELKNIYFNQLLVASNLNNTYGDYNFIDGSIVDGNLRPVWNNGVNIIGINVENTNTSAEVNYSFYGRNTNSGNANGGVFNWSTGWKAQDAYSGRHGNSDGFFDFSTSGNIGQLSDVTRTDGTPINNGDASFWLGIGDANNLNRLNAQYVFDSRGIEFASVVGLANLQKMGYKPNTKGRYRYGLVKTQGNESVSIDILTKNFFETSFGPAQNNTATYSVTINRIVFRATLTYKNGSRKRIERWQQINDWAGRKIVRITIPSSDLTEDLVNVKITQRAGTGTNPTLNTSTGLYN